MTPSEYPEIHMDGCYQLFPDLGGFLVHFMGFNTFQLLVYVLIGICIL